MGATLEVVSVFTDTEDTRLAGISDLEITVVNGLPVLLVGSEAESAVTSYSLADPGMPLQVSQIDYSADSGTLVLTGLETYERDGGTYAITWGRYDDNYAIYQIDETGALSFDRVFAGEVDQPDRGLAAEMIAIGDTHFLVTTEFDRAGLYIYRYDADDTITALKPVWDSSTSYLGDVVDLEYGEFYGKRMLATAGALDAGIHIFYISSSGSTQKKFTYSPSDGLGFNTISDIEFVEVSGKPYLVVAGAGTDSLHVLRLKSNYSLSETDSYIDTHETRFAEISSMETFTYGDRSFVVAAGADEGVTLFEIDWRGQLILLDVLTDDFDTTLANISDLEVHLVDNMAHIYVSSSVDHGFTVLEFDMERTGVMKTGNNKANKLVGTMEDDAIWGKNNKDVLRGRAGDDRLHDGKGRDKMFGGDGEDVFVFQPDSKKDNIMDFEPGIDRIDLSEYDNLWHISSLEIRDTKDGNVIIKIGDDKIKVYAGDGHDIDADSFSQDDFIFG